MILNLDKETRKKFYKLVTSDKFTREYAHIKGDPQFLLKETGTNNRSPNKKKLDDYYDKNALLQNKIIATYNEVIRKTISSKFKKANSLNTLVKNKTLSEIQNDDNIDLIEYQKEFDTCGLPFSFSDYLIYLTVPEKNEADDISKKRAREELEDLHSELSRLKTELAQKIKDIDNLTKDKKKLEKSLRGKDQEIKELKEKHQKELAVVKKKADQEIEALQLQIENNKDSFDLKQFNTTISNILNMNIIGKTYSEVIAKLTVLENEFLNQEEYERYSEVLVAKYIISNVLIGEKKNELLSR